MNSGSQGLLVCPSLRYHQRAVPLFLSAPHLPACFLQLTCYPHKKKTTLFSARWGAGWLHGPHHEPGEGREGGRAGDGEERPTLPKGSADLGSYLALFPLSLVFTAAQL